MATLPIMIGASLISSVIGGLLGGKAANEQAAGAINASNQANAIRDNQYQLTRSDNAPYTNLGRESSITLSNLLGVGPKPGTSAGTLASPVNTQDLQDKVNKAAFLQAWLDGKNPTGADGRPIGPAPGNAATRAKVQGELDGLKRDIQSQQQILANSAQEGQIAGRQDPNAFGSLMKDFTLADFNADPGYNFRLGEGEKAIERSAAARGGVQSGGTLKALTRYNSDYASGEIDKAVSRFNNNRQFKTNTLLSSAGLGQVSSGQVAAIGNNVASDIAGNTAEGLTAAANARASSYTNWANSINSGINNAINLYANRDQIQTGRPATPTYGTPPFIPSGTARNTLAYPRVN